MENKSELYSHWHFDTLTSGLLFDGMVLNRWVRMYAMKGNGKTVLSTPNNTFVYVHKGQAFIDTSYLLYAGMSAVVHNAIIEGNVDAEIYMVEVLSSDSAENPLHPYPLQITGSKGLYWHQYPNEIAQHAVLLNAPANDLPALITAKFPAKYELEVMDAEGMALVISGSADFITERGDPAGHLQVRAGSIFRLHVDHSVQVKEEMQVILVHPAYAGYDYGTLSHYEK